MKNSKAKKILLVDNSSWNIYNFRQPHILKLKSLGYDVTVATPIDEYFGNLRKNLVARYIQLRHLYPQKKNPVQDIFFFFELLLIYRRVKPDLVIHFTIKPNIYGSIVARILGIPVVNVVTGLGYTFLHAKGLNRLIPYMYRFAFSQIKKLVVYNRDDLNVFVTKEIVPKDKCRLVSGSGVNTNQFRPLPNGKNNDAFVFLFIGRLLHDKGLREYVEAAKILANQNKRIECWIVGNFTYTNPSAVQKEELFEWVQNGYVRYFGFSNDVRAYLKYTDVMVLPSHRGEGIPRSILEAMSMGKPIITTETAGCRETVIHGQNGYLVPVGDAASLADAMGLLFESQENDRKVMGQQSRKRALELFDEKIIASRFAEIISEVLPTPKHESARIKSSAVF